MLENFKKMPYNKRKQLIPTGITLKRNILLYFLLIEAEFFSFFLFYYLLPGSGSDPNILDPDPGKSSGSNRIQIHNTVFFVKMFFLEVDIGTFWIRICILLADPDPRVF